MNKQRVFTTVRNHRETSTVKKYWSKSTMDKLQTLRLHFDVKTLFRPPTLSSLLTSTCLFLLFSFHSLLVTFLSMYAITPSSSIFWILQVNPGFIFTASYSDFSGPWYRDMPTTRLTSADFLSLGERFCKPLFSDLDSKARSTRLKLPSCTVSGDITWSPCSITSSPAF